MSDRTYEQAAEELNVSVAFLKKNAQARLIPHQRYGRAVRFTDADLLAIRAQFHEAPVSITSTNVLRLRRRAA